MEDHHRAMVDGQAPEAALELVAIDDRAQALRPPPARRPAGDGGWVPNAGSGDPRRSRRARGAGTTRRQSAPGRGVGEGLARWSAAPAASHPRRGRCRAGSCAPPRGAGRPTATARLAKASSSPCCARPISSASTSSAHRRPVDPDVHTVWAAVTSCRLNTAARRQQPTCQPGSSAVWGRCHLMKRHADRGCGPPGVRAPRPGRMTFDGAALSVTSMEGTFRAATNARA